MKALFKAPILLLLFNALLIGCDPSGPGQPGPPVHLLMISGDSQVAEINSQLPEPLVVRVVDSDSLGVPDVEVHWVIYYRGSASEGPRGAVVTPALARTDTRGFAVADVRLGSVAGLYVTTAWAPEADHPLQDFYAAAASFERSCREMIPKADPVFWGDPSC